MKKHLKIIFAVFLLSLIFVNAQDTILEFGKESIELKAKEVAKQFSGLRVTEDMVQDGIKKKDSHSK